MNIVVLCVGKKKTIYDNMILEYQKRCTIPFMVQYKIIESNGNIEKNICITDESKRILENIETSDYVVALDEFGKDFTTMQLCEKLKTVLSGSYKRIVFIIGGAYGFNEHVKERADLVLKLSHFTLPHELVRLILSEQLYRVYSIYSGGKYHHP